LSIVGTTTVSQKLNFYLADPSVGGGSGGGTLAEGGRWLEERSSYR